MAETKVWARRPIEYDRKQYDRGQIFSLTGQINDERLVRLGYVQKVTKQDEPHQCAVCGAYFIDNSTRTAHGDYRHTGKVMSPEEEERHEERQERLLDQVAPLNLGATAASRR